MASSDVLLGWLCLSASTYSIANRRWWLQTADCGRSQPAGQTAAAEAKRRLRALDLERLLGDRNRTPRHRAAGTPQATPRHATSNAVSLRRLPLLILFVLLSGRCRHRIPQAAASGAAERPVA